MHSRETCGWKWDDKDFCNKRKEKRNSQGKDPRTFDENSQGCDLSTQERNSQGEDPRTLKDNSQGGDLRILEANSQGTDPRTFVETHRKVASARKAEGRAVEEEEEKEGKEAESEV